MSEPAPRDARLPRDDAGTIYLIHFSRACSPLIAAAIFEGIALQLAATVTASASSIATRTQAAALPSLLRGEELTAMGQPTPRRECPCPRRQLRRGR